MASNGVAALPAGEVHAWSAQLDMADPAPGLLSDEERARAGRMPPTRRRHFMAARTILRRLLAWYLEQDPAALVFEYGPAGKPRLADGDIEFNLAHSGELALFAVSRAGAVGIDLERVLPIRDLDRAAAAWLGAGELEPCCGCRQELGSTASIGSGRGRRLT